MANRKSTKRYNLYLKWNTNKCILKRLNYLYKKKTNYELHRAEKNVSDPFRKPKPKTNGLNQFVTAPT